MPCPYPKGSKEAKEFMAQLRARRGKGECGGKRRKKGGASTISDFIRDLFTSAQYAHERRGGRLKDDIRHFSEKMTGVSDAKEARRKIISSLNRRQLMYLRNKIWISEAENGVPKDVFNVLTGSTGNGASGGAIPLWLVKLIGQVGLNAALTLWDKHKQKLQRNAMRY